MGVYFFNVWVAALIGKNRSLGLLLDAGLLDEDDADCLCLTAIN